MACHIAANPPLARLRAFLGLPEQCHSFRPRCAMGLEAGPKAWTLGAPGAAIGYCQALFGRAGVAAEHTRHVLRLLQEIDAPWANSHEMFWGHIGDEPPEQFLVGGMTPLVGSGRVPVLITSLDPAADGTVIDSIFAAQPPICPGETVLVRLVLERDGAVAAAASLMRRLVDRAVSDHEMPTWWPLWQSPASVDVMVRLKSALGELWKYANVAVNPFTPNEVHSLVGDQLTVAQVVVGAADGIASDGQVTLAAGMTISGAAPLASYSLPAYFEKLSDLETPPTLILLGPSRPSWTDGMNQERIAKLLPHLHSACTHLWHRIEKNRRDQVWRMSA